MSGKLVHLFDVARRGRTVDSARMRVSTQRAERRRSLNAAINLARARNALGACGQCERTITKQSLVYHVPAYELFFCVPCGVVWRDEIYPLLKGRSDL